MTPTAVSVVINTLNRRETLANTLVALRDQTYDRFEVIVVNGPSNDGTAEMLAQFRDSARLYDCAQAVVGVSRNIGIDAAAGELVAFIDDDAIASPTWLEVLTAPFADEHVSAVGGPVFDVPLGEVDWEICTCTRLGEPNTRSTPPIDQYVGVGSDPFPYLAGCNMVFRRSALAQVGGFNPKLSYAYDDVEVCCRLNDAGYSIDYVDQVLVDHHRAASSVRDPQQVITDPYWILRSRIMFALQCEHQPLAAAEILGRAQQWVADWGGYASTHLASGRFTAEQHEQFLRRAHQGVADGQAAGAEPRPLATFGPRPVEQFREYRATRR